eukprot:5548794-Prorocentrum_lima.AAC.1
MAPPLTVLQCMGTLKQKAGQPVHEILGVEAADLFVAEIKGAQSVLFWATACDRITGLLRALPVEKRDH